MSFYKDNVLCLCCVVVVQDQQHMYFGAGNLADLLPEVGMADEACEEGAHDIETMSIGSGRLNSSQLPLPETDPSQPTQGRADVNQPGVLTNASKMVLRCAHRCNSFLVLFPRLFPCYCWCAGWLLQKARNAQAWLLCLLAAGPMASSIFTFFL
jgi:hypothetical protein